MLHFFLSTALVNAMPLLKASFIELQSQDHTICNKSIEELICPDNGKRPDCSSLQEQVQSHAGYCSQRAKLGQQRLGEETKAPQSLLEAEAAHMEIACFCLGLKVPSLLAPSIQPRPPAAPTQSVLCSLKARGRGVLPR